MSNSLSYDQITRTHPAYVAGFTAGVDVGLKTALEIVVLECARQDHLETASHAYAAGRLSAVARAIGASFRTSAG
jgi:hypothetical protein